MQTIPGGAYQDRSGNWHDANGKPLTKVQIEAAQKAIAAHQEELDAAEAARAARDPDVARALASLLQGKSE